MKIALDVDDVLAAFVPHVHHHFGKTLEEKIDHWSVPLMNSRLGEGWFGKIALNEKFWATLPVYSYAQDIDFDFHYYISSFPKEMYHVREEWLKKKGFPPHPLIVTHDKLGACKELGVNILVDDKPEMMRILEGTEVRGIHFIPEYAEFQPIGEHVYNLQNIKALL